MRKNFLLFTLVMFACSGFLLGQTKAADSINKLLQAHVKNDNEKVDLIFELSRELRRSKPLQVDSVVEQGLLIANQLNYTKGKGHLLTIKALRYYDLSDYPSSYKTFDEARKILESIDDKKGLAYLLRMNANLLMDDGKHAQSLDDFLKALKLAQEVGDVKQIVEVERTIGYLYNVLGEYQKAIPYQEDALKQAQSIGYTQGVSSAYNAIGKTYKTSGDYPASLDAYTKGLLIDEQFKDSANIYIDHSNIGDVYERMGNYPQAFSHLWQAWNYYKKVPRSTLVPWDEWALAKAYTHSGRADSGLYYAKHSYQLSQQLGWRLYLREITQIIAESAAKLNQWDTAYKYQVLSSHYKDSLTGEDIARKTAMLESSFQLDKKQAEIELQKAENRKEKAFLIMVLGGLASVIVLAIILFRNNRNKQRANVLLQKQKEEIDKKAHELSVQKDNLEQSYHNVELLGDIGRKITSSLTVEKIIGTVYDNVNVLMDASVFGIGIYNDELKRIDFPATYENGVALPFYSNSIYEENRFAALSFLSGKEIVMGDLEKDYQNYLQNIPVPKQGTQAVSFIYLPLKAKDKVLGVITIQSFQKNAYTDYHLYMLRNIAIYTAIALENAEAFKKLNFTIDSLKKAQAQLVQSEKMASLGELTAGIAHEIQNPLNFVNNFSEVNTELIEEMKEELKTGKIDAAIKLSEDLKQNNEKINFHGKRADSIVKSMLQHSRNSSGQKEPTDINLLTDECLRLSYHGLRAKDKSFNAKMQTDFEQGLPQVNVAPQDIGRVLLNLLTNAFYSVMQKQKKNGQNYEPMVSVYTKRDNGKIEIGVKDNGSGIPPKALDKIFQPFFTTKPTGEGTGLGLSMSYDIITKGHNGELRVDTKEGEYAEFIIILPS